VNGQKLKSTIAILAAQIIVGKTYDYQIEK
jgi:hypothetical protein